LEKAGRKNQKETKKIKEGKEKRVLGDIGYKSSGLGEKRKEREKKGSSRISITIT